MKAYPIMYKHPTTGLIVEEQGMDLRDWFAGLAMQGLFAHKPWNQVYRIDHIAKEAYEIADEMMKQREVKND
jgi:hypothetical protein